MLTAEKRTQLEVLINQAEDNKETPEFIQNELIPAFKAKYDTPEPVKVAEPEPTKPTFSQIQEEQKGKDVADLKGLYDRSVNRGESVYAPTTIGDALKQKPGTIGDAIIGTPERAVRLGAATVGTAADVVNTGLKIATRGLIGEKPGEVAASAIQKTGLPELVAPAIKKYQEFKSNLDPASRANIGAAESGLSALGTFGGIKTGENVAKRLVGEGSVLKESGPKGVVKALVDPLKNETGSVSPNKPYTIPDIDDIADVEDAAKSVVDLPKNMGEIKKNIGQPPKKGIRNYALTVDEQEFLSKPESLTETPFPVVMQQASLAKQKRFEGVLTPLDKAAADKGGEALKLISSKKSEIGKIKGDLVDAADDYLIATNQFADATPIQQRFVELVRDRLGAQFDERGRLVDAAGRIMNDSAEKGLIIKMARTISKLRPETTLKELDDVVMDLRNMVEHKKSSQTKQIFTKADGIGEAVRGDIKNLIDDHLENSVNWGGADDFLGKEGAATLKGSLRDYANIAKIEDRLNRGLGEVVDPVTGQAKMGASLLKSSLMSNSDRGTKALFRAVNDLTGIDLMKEAAKAEIAMKAVGDDRINDLLKEAGAIRSFVQGDKLGGLLKLGESGIKKLVTGEKPDQLLRYYYKHHPDAEMVIPEPKKDVLGTYQRPAKKQETIGEVLSSKGVPKLESKKEKPSTIGDALKRTFGNERGAVGSGETIQELDALKRSLLDKVAPLVSKKKELYSNADITTPKSIEEKALDKEIAGIYSEINSIVKKRRDLKPKTIGSILKNERGSVGSENPQIHTDNFKNWFGDWKNKPEEASKVVDEEGEPLRLYHGTMGKFNEFDKGKIGSSNNGEGAFFVTGDKEAASEYAIMNYSGNAKESPNVMPVYVDVKNPFVSKIKQYSTAAISKEVRTAKEAGHDGVVFPNLKGFGEEGQIAVFSPNQIKSATGNSGAFSKSTNDIRGSSALKTMAATGATAAGALTIGEAIKAKKKK